MICPICNNDSELPSCYLYHTREVYITMIKELKKRNKLLKKVNMMRWEEMVKMKKEIERLRLHFTPTETEYVTNLDAIMNLQHSLSEAKDEIKELKEARTRKIITPKSFVRKIVEELQKIE